ncbi:hypothetical protein Tco_0157069 [Tanacetum coccineum]
MDLYYSRLTQDDLDGLIIKYKIPRDLHPRLPSEEFVMSKLPDDAIGIYRRMFDFSGIEPTVTLFRVFQTLCKQGDWFSFAKRRAPSPRHPDIAIDDPRPASSSFSMADVRHLSAHVIKLRDMSEGVLVLAGLIRVWKSRVCDPVLRVVDGNVMGIHDFLCLPKWTGVEVQEEPHLDVRLTLQRIPFYCTSSAAVDVVIPNPTLEDLVVGTPSSNILAKAEASHKRKASTSSTTSSHVAKCTRSALAQSSSSTTRPSLFVGDYDDESDGDDDACVEIPLVTPLRSAAVISSLRNQGQSSTAPTAEGPNTRDSRSKGIMVDDAATPSIDLFPFYVGPYYATYPQYGVARNYEFTREEWDDPYRPTFGFPTPGEMVRVEELFEDQLTVKMSVLHCMMMSHGGELLARYRGLLQSHHEYVFGLNDKLDSSDASFAKSKAKGKERKKKIKSLTKSLDNLYAEVAHLSVAINQATVLEAKKDEEILRLNMTPLEFSSFFRGQFQDWVRKFLASDEFSRVQGELLSLAANAGFERGLSMHQTKDEFTTVLKKTSNFMPSPQDRLVEASPLLLELIMPFLTRFLSMLLNLYRLSFSLSLKNWLVWPTSPLQGMLVFLFNAPPPPSKDDRVTTNESTVTPTSKSLELSANINLTASAVASEHNEEMVNAEVDGSEPKMTDDTVAAKSGHAFVSGIYVALEDDVELVEVGSGRASSGLNDVVVALSVGEKGDGLVPSSAAGEKAAPNSSRV